MNQSISPEKYIKTRARTLKIDRCLVNADWNSSMFAHVIVIRKHTNGNFTFAGYLVDLLCLGVKDTFYGFNHDEDDVKELLDVHEMENEMVEIEYPLAHNIIFAGQELASEYHIPQHRDFVNVTKYLLEEDDEKVPLIEVHTGDEDGLPHLIVPSLDSNPSALACLKKFAGEGGYHYTVLENEGIIEEDGYFDEDYENEELEDEFPDCHLWKIDDWKSFINNISPENHNQFRQEFSYIFLMAITKPDLENRGLDLAVELSIADKGVDWHEEGDENEYIKTPEESTAIEKIYSQITKNGATTKEIKKVLSSIQDCIKRWPNNPLFRNYQYNAYLLLNDYERAEAEIFETLRLFPDYLVGKTIYADYLVANDRANEMPAVFNSKKYLFELYSHRSSFHINEFMHFNTAWLFYYTSIEDHVMADFYGRLLEIMPDDLLRDKQLKLLDMLDLQRSIRVMELVSKSLESTVEMDNLIRLLMPDPTI
jgi:tetratricopeptide (TPR) repeat protein